jgi:hypothetical protein
MGMGTLLEGHVLNQENIHKEDLFEVMMQHNNSNQKYVALKCVDQEINFSFEFLLRLRLL